MYKVIGQSVENNDFSPYVISQCSHIHMHIHTRIPTTTTTTTSTTTTTTTTTHVCSAERLNK